MTYESNESFEKCIFKDNSATYGEDIYSKRSELSINECSFERTQNNTGKTGILIYQEIYQTNTNTKNIINISKNNKLKILNFNFIFIRSTFNQTKINNLNNNNRIINNNNKESSYYNEFNSQDYQFTSTYLFTQSYTFTPSKTSTIGITYPETMSGYHSYSNIATSEMSRVMTTIKQSVKPTSKKEKFNKASSIAIIVSCNIIIIFGVAIIIVFILQMRKPKKVSFFTEDDSSYRQNSEEFNFGL